MSTRLTCPSCHRQLLLPADCTAELLSCPRCLANIPNPQAPDTSAAVQTTLPPVPPTPVTPPSVTPPVPNSDVDVRRDQRGTGGLMIVLSVFGAIGISYTMLLFGSMAIRDKEFQPLVITLWVLAACTAVSAAFVFGGSPSRTLGANIGRTLLGVLSISGGILVAGILVVLAVFIFLFVVCLANGGKC